MPAVKVLLTGKGRVGNGAKEMLDGMGMKEVSVNEFLNQTFSEAVYCQIDVLDYNIRKDGRQLGEQYFFENPGDYLSNFMRFARVADLYIAGHFYGQGAPYLSLPAKMPAIPILISAWWPISVAISMVR